MTVCRIGKRCVNSYADRYRAPIGSLFYMEVYVHQQYGVIVTEKLSWWHLTSFSHSNFESGFLALRKPSAYLCELWSPLTHLQNFFWEKLHVNDLIPCRMWEKKRSCVSLLACLSWGRGPCQQPRLSQPWPQTSEAGSTASWHCPENSHMGNGDQIM